MCSATMRLGKDCWQWPMSAQHVRLTMMAKKKATATHAVWTEVMEDRLMELKRAKCLFNGQVRFIWPGWAEFVYFRPFHWSVSEISTHKGHRAMQNELAQYCSTTHMTSSTWCRVCTLEHLVKRILCSAWASNILVLWICVTNRKWT